AAGRYRLVGDQNGVIAISNILVTNNSVVAGQLATATVQLQFAQPLPDDRYTLTVYDTLLDPAGNRLDGENNAAEPQENPHFPSGIQNSADPVAGNFSTTHPGDEIGLFNSGKWYLDTGGDNNVGGPGDTQLNGNMKGQPIVGDFDGDGKDDLATWDPGNASSP